MTAYNTRSLAEALIGDDGKQATRTTRKFLRDELGGGKAVVGKGGRYNLDYNKRELTALTKKFKAWETAQEAAKIARAAEMAERAKTAGTAVILPDDSNGDDADILDENTESDNPATGPTDEEMAEMLAEGDDEDETDIED
jgi:uncharacterized protein YecE (DUF72 family)